MVRHLPYCYTFPCGPSRLCLTLTSFAYSHFPGVNSLFPEMVLLPSWFPLHTSRLWCYCRTVYMPMTYIYGKRVGLLAFIPWRGAHTLA